VLLADPCAYCGEPSEHVDHIEPGAHGGVDDWTNLTGACARCNRVKGDRWLITFLLARFTGKAAFGTRERAVRRRRAEEVREWHRAERERQAAKVAAAWRPQTMNTPVVGNAAVRAYPRG
jgi:hypothetical protein